MATHCLWFMLSMVWHHTKDNYDITMPTLQMRLATCGHPLLWVEGRNKRDFWPDHRWHPILWFSYRVVVFKLFHSAVPLRDSFKMSVTADVCSDATRQDFAVSLSVPPPARPGSLFAFLTLSDYWLSTTLLHLQFHELFYCSATQHCEILSLLLAEGIRIAQI